MRSSGGSLAVVLIATFTLLFVAGPAAAHTGFESSSPADGDVLSEPVNEITITFTGDATPAGEGFVVLDPSGTIREPDEVTTVDNLTWVLRFDEPLAGGDVGVRWMVAAPDTHPIEGSFSFTVTAPSPDPTASGTESNTDPSVEPLETDPSAEPLETASNSTDSSATDSVDLGSFLDVSADDPSGANLLATLSRAFNMIGAVFVIGSVAFAIFGLRGDPLDIRAVLYWVRRAGSLLVFGAIGEAVATTATLAGKWSALVSPTDMRTALWSSVGAAIAFRAVGGLLATGTTGLKTKLAAASNDPALSYANDHAWDYRVSLGSLVGAALAASSFMFDGHTASKGPRWLHAVANVTHVTAAAIWAGGVTMLALTVWRRRQTDRPIRALQLATRFSVIATVALVAVGLAGVALSVVVLDSISQLWSTPWGRLLALKVVVVGVAAAGGTYNHLIMVPALEHGPDHEPTVKRFRTVVTAEAIALVVVSVITAFLVVASTE